MSTDEWKLVYDKVHQTPWTAGTGSIQWKGTDVCIDILCPCGHQAHHDGDFLYSWRCSQCGTVYALDPVVRLVALTPEESEVYGEPKDEQEE